MGEVGVVSANDNIRPEEARVSFGSGSGKKLCTPPDIASITPECLTAAEEAAEHVLICVQPTLDSEEKRRDVIDHLQQLIQSRLRCEVVPYGSVPLKTYLPDGDIDLTILTSPNAVESLVHDVLALLQGEEANENVEYRVKETQFIDAEVKLVKCFLRGFLIDISFNQLGGLSTLCFLEQMDRLVGRDHLLKRSIILIKTWCYYESRILGAPHGLISTYALEILVLYIFHHFHSSLIGPFYVLYKFLDYYSQFDWEHYCISLKGPVYKSSMPDTVAVLAVKKIPEGALNHLLLSEEFLDNCLELFSVRAGAERAFQPKHLNVIDPLKANNNLGRSVHRGNFYRIRSAFKFGARKLGQVLLRSSGDIADEISKFFTNTRSRHERPSTHYTRRLAVDFGDEASFAEPLSPRVELLFSDDEDTLLTSPDRNFDAVKLEECVDSGEMESVSEALDPLADLTGDYDSYIISLLRGQLCHGFSSYSRAGGNRPLSPPRIRNGKPPGVVTRSQPIAMNGLAFSRTSSCMLSTGHITYRGPDSCDAFGFDGKRVAGGTRTYIPHMNHFHRHDSDNGIYSAGEMKSFENGSYEVLHGRRRYYGRKRRSDVQNQSSGNQENGFLTALYRIEFGSIGGLDDEVISCSARADLTSMKPHSSSALLIRQRVVGHSIWLKNEDEFPPLGL